MSSKIINYTNRDFNSLREFAINYVKQFYPDTYQDFNKASVGAMLIDIQCYIGDILSFYIDYQGNEVFLDSSQQIDNIVKLAREKGYKDTGKPSAIGLVDMYINIPAGNDGLPNANYIPIVRKNSLLGVSQTNASYIINADKNFGDSNTTFIVSAVNDQGVPTSYALKTVGEVISGALYVQNETIESYEEFLKIKINNPLMSEIISVIDSNGNEYYQVDYLTQNIVYKFIKNTDYDSSLVPYKLTKIYCPRRFVIEQHDGFYYLVFGKGSIDSVIDPRNLILNYYSREFISERKIDPTNIIENDKFGIAPYNTILTINYRANNSIRMAAPQGQLNKVFNIDLKFPELATDQAIVNQIRNSFEVENSLPITSVSQIITTEDLKRRAYGAESSQFRCVTAEDYIYAAYSMNPKLGAIKLANIVVDRNSPRRSLQMYIMSEDYDGNLAECSETLKNNLKTWLFSQKMINDSIQILTPFIVNFGIEFIVDTNDSDKNLVYLDCINALKNKFARKMDIGESIDISSIYKTLNSLKRVVDTKKVKIILKNQTGYSSVYYDFYGNLSADGSLVYGQENIVFELKNFDKDINGSII